MFVAVKFRKNVNFDKYKYFGFGIGFVVNGNFLLSFGKNVLIFGVDMSSSVHVDNKKKDFLIFGKGIKQEIDDATLTTKNVYTINFSEQQKKVCFRFTL